MKTVSIGLVGCGAWGKHILRDLKSLGVQVGVVARSEGSIANARGGKADHIFPSLAGLSKLTNLSGVVVASSTATHYSVLVELIRLFPTLPLFCEKPVADRLAHALHLLELQPNLIFVMDKWRYHPGVLKLAEIAREESLGKVLGVHTERLAWGTAHRDLNSVWHLLPHDNSILLEILGYLPPVTAARSEFVAEKCVGISVLLGGAPWATTRVSSYSPFRVRRVQLVCEQGVAVLEDSYSSAIRIARGPLDEGDTTPAITEILLPSHMPLLAEITAFVKFIAGEGSPPKSSLQEAVDNIAAIERALALGGSPG